MGKITYLGIDESTLGIGADSSFVVAAQTCDPRLAKDLGYKALEKARDYVQKGKPLPQIEDMQGLDMFHWSRVRGGRFPKLILEHAVIANLVKSNGYAPASTVLLIDRFHAKDAESHFLIKEYLHANGFKIPHKNIDIIGEADQRVPIVNYADLIAFQIGLQLNERYSRFHKARKFMQEPYHVPIDMRRTISISPEGRELLEKLIKRYRG